MFSLSGVRETERAYREFQSKVSLLLQSRTASASLSTCPPPPRVSDGPENIYRNASNNDKLVRRVVYSRVLLLSETDTEFKTAER
jgi:hypothetical protein